MTAREDETAPLAEGARRFVDAARPFERLPPERKARVRGRVLAAIAAGAAVSTVAAEATAAASAEGIGAAGSALEGAAGAGAGTGTAGSTIGVAGLGAGATKAAGLSLFTKIGLAVALVTAGAGGYLWKQAQSATTVPPASATSAGSAASVIASSSVPAGAEAPPKAPTDPSGAPERPSAPASNAISALPAAPGSRASTAPSGAEKPGTDPGAAAADSAPQADTLPEENKLLAAAHAALARGDAAGALALLDEHATRFPRGALAPERRAARAMALCKQGRSADGRREADALYGADSKSPLAEKIRRACDR